MIKDINRFKKIQKTEYKKVLNEIENQIKETEWIDFTFPQIHGLNISKEKNEYKIYNILEAREFLNDKTLNKNLISICKSLLKLENLDFLNPTDQEKIKASLTLFDYITNTNIKALLSFRNYDEKIIDKFTYNRSFIIFKKLIDKFFNEELDKSTLILIESEIFIYSEKETILKNINKKELNEAENILIRYSEISSLVTDSYLENTTTIKEFYKNLSKEEKKLFNKFNINKKKVRKLKREKNKTRNLVTSSFLIVILISSIITIIGIKSNTEVIILQQNSIYSKLTKIPILTRQEIETNIQEIKKAEEEAQKEKEEKEKQALEAAKPKPKPVTTTYNYVEPTGVGNIDMINIASAQIGNVGGQPFWSWYGFSSRVAWCGCFVSWVANQAGISEDIIPRFSRTVEGANWFINRQLFRDRNYSPRPGDLIFFDYDYNGNSDHVGIVKSVQNGRVYTIEGNVSNDQCKELSYRIGSSEILGYGTPNY